MQTVVIIHVRMVPRVVRAADQPFPGDRAAEPFGINLDIEVIDHAAYGHQYQLQNYNDRMHGHYHDDCRKNKRQQQ